jgi:hypothetical protein
VKTIANGDKFQTETNTTWRLVPDGNYLHVGISPDGDYLPVETRSRWMVPE